MIVDTAKQILRWLLLIGLIFLGLLYFNSAFYSWWASWGPPTDYPKAWEHRGLSHFGFGLASIATAIMVFVSLKKGFSLKSSKFKYVWLMVVVAIFIYPKSIEWLEIDRCLDGCCL